MSYKLVIVESPAKCEKIESYLGSEYKCATNSHKSKTVFDSPTIEENLC